MDPLRLIHPTQALKPLNLLALTPRGTTLNSLKTIFTLFMHRTKYLLILSVTFSAISLLLMNSHAFAEANKWVDKDGVTHYGDRVPREYLRSEHLKLNDQGVVIHKSHAIKSEAELAEEYKQNKIKAEENRKKLIKQKIQQLRDRVLLDTFTTVNDIVAVRDARLEALDSQISLASTLIKNDEEKLSHAQKRITEIEESKRDIPENLRKEVTSINKQLDANYEFIKEKKKERAQIISSFAEDFIRFQELMIERKKEKQRRAEEAKAREENLRF